MSKAFAFAAGRLGYLAAAPAFIEALRIVRLPYHLRRSPRPPPGRPGACAGDVGEGRPTAARPRRSGELARRRGLQVAESDANFVLFGRFEDRHAVWQALLDRGVLIRETGPDGWLRVSAGTPTEMQAFKDALAAVLETEIEKEIP